MLSVRSLDLAVSALLGAFGLYVVVTGLGYGFIDHGTPAAGFFPVFIGIGIAGFSSINLINVFRRGDYATVRRIPTKEIMRVVLTSVALIGFVILAAPLGMLVAGFLLMLVVAIIFGARTPTMILRSCIAAAVMSGVLYLIFVRFLSIVLP